MGAGGETISVADEQLRSFFDRLLAAKEEKEGGIVDELDRIYRAELGGLATDDMRALGFDCIIALLDECLGSTSRDTNRACYQASQMAGVKYDRFHHILKRVRIDGIRAVRPFASELRFRVTPGCVYVAAEDGGDRVKVGFSRSPEVRVEHLCRLTHMPLRLVGAVFGFPLTETSLQVALRAAWLGGEWYSADALLSDRRAAA